MGRSRRSVPHALPPAVQPAPTFGEVAWTLVEGIAFFGGNPLPRMAVEWVLSPWQVEHVHTEAEGALATKLGPALSDACSSQLESFQNCIAANGSDISKCQFYMNTLNECRTGGAQVTAS